MDWESIRKAICDGRQFSSNEQGARVLSDIIMPSGGMVFVNLQFRHGSLFGHDGGSAFDELAKHGMEVGSMMGVRRMLAKTSFRVSDDGLIWRDRVDPASASLLVSLVADASLRAAQYLLARGRFSTAAPLDQRVKDTMRRRFPGGRTNFAFQGKNRQQVFDFGIVVEGKTVLIEAVTPDSASVSAAIVKGLDASQAPGANVIPLFVYDPSDEWKSGSLNMLQFGGTGISIDRISEGSLPIAA
jgi:hypothetical protein